MFGKIKDFFSGAVRWVKDLLARHDGHLQQMASSLVPLIAELALRSDLSGEEKRKLLASKIVENAEAEARDIGTSMINEAIEMATNRYNIEVGKLTKEKMDSALEAVLKAGRDYANEKLKLDGDS
jgi:broad-specificity NMP kinase